MKSEVALSADVGALNHTNVPDGSQVFSEWDVQCIFGKAQILLKGKWNVLGFIPQRRGCSWTGLPSSSMKHPSWAEFSTKSAQRHWASYVQSVIHGSNQMWLMVAGSSSLNTLGSSPVFLRKGQWKCQALKMSCTWFQCNSKAPFLN